MLAAIAVVRPTSRSLLVSRRSMVSPLNSSGQGEDGRRHLPAQTLHLPALGRGEWPGSPAAELLLEQPVVGGLLAEDPEPGHRVVVQHVGPLPGLEQGLVVLLSARVPLERRDKRCAGMKPAWSWVWKRPTPKE